MGSDVDWGTVERLDGPLLATDTAQPTEEVLEVPELTSEVLDAMMEAEAESSQSQSLSDNADDTETPEAQRGAPGSQVECETCGKSVRVRKDGYLSVHRCEPKAGRGDRFTDLPKRKRTTPPKVRDFGINVLAWAVEEGSARAVARPFGVDPADVPSELPDAEGMLGPPLDLLWPSIPESAQKFIAACADNSDLIACALAWGDWLNVLGKWTREQRAINQQLAEQQRRSNGYGSSESEGPYGGRLVPFSPS